MRLLALLAAGLFAGSLFAADDKKDDKKPKDEDAIVGKWQVEKIDNGTAESPPADELAKHSMTFGKDGKLLVTGPKGEDKGKYKLDPDAKPKAIDLSGERGTALAAYSLDGDTLTLAVTVGGRTERPDALKADRKGISVMTLKRVKDEKKDK